MPNRFTSHYSLGMTTSEPPAYPGDSTPGDTPPPPGGSGTSDLPTYGSVPPPEGSTPPPPPPPPSAPGGSAEEFSAPAAIGWGWEKFKDNVGQSLLAMLILVVVSAVLSGIASLITPGSAMMYPGGASFDLNGGNLVWTFIVSVIVSAASYVVTVAIARGTIDVTNGESLDIGGAFGKINVANALVAGLIVGVLTQIGFALFVLPGVIVTFFAYFTAYFVADGASPVDGLQKSFSLIGANIGSALVLAILSILRDHRRRDRPLRRRLRGRSGHVLRVRLRVPPVPRSGRRGLTVRVRARHPTGCCARHRTRAPPRAGSRASGH